MLRTCCAQTMRAPPGFGGAAAWGKERVVMGQGHRGSVPLWNRCRAATTDSISAIEAPAGYPKLRQMGAAVFRDLSKSHSKYPSIVGLPQRFRYRQRSIPNRCGDSGVRAAELKATADLFAEAIGDLDCCHAEVYWVAFRDPRSAAQLMLTLECG